MTKIAPYIRYRSKNVLDMLMRSNDPPNRLSDEGQTIRTEVVDHDKLLAELGPTRDIGNPDPFLNFHEWSSGRVGI